MTFREFADAHRLRIARDDDGMMIVPGRDGFLYEFRPGRLAATVVDSTPRKWTNKRRAGELAGMALIQSGDSEGTLLFDPRRSAQVDAAFAAVKPKRRRVPSPAQLAVLAKARESLRTGPSSVQNRDGVPEGSSGAGETVHGGIEPPNRPVIRGAA